jgi:hypothetical protein
MGEGQMNIIYQIFVNLPDNLLMNYTAIEQVNPPSSHIGKMLYQHRDSDIPKKNIICLLLNHGLGMDG